MNKYPINEIFYSLQGEGHNAGRPAVFIRFSGCNIKCPFCDTDHSNRTMMSADEIISAVSQYNCRFIVLTGGEPSLWIDQQLVDVLHTDYEIAIETNGTNTLPANINWVTLSPKQHIIAQAKVALRSCDELKIIWEESIDIDHLLKTTYQGLKYRYLYIQPCDTGDNNTNRQLQKEATDYCLTHPDARLSVQLHKILNIK